MLIWVSNSSRTQPKDSVVEWAQNGDSVENKDILLFLTVGQYSRVLSHSKPR